MGEPPEAVERAWRAGEPVDLTRERPTTAVLSIRVPDAMLETLGERAAALGKPTSVLAREMIEQGLASEWPRTPAELARAFARWVDEITARGGSPHVRKKPRRSSPRR